MGKLFWALAGLGVLLWNLFVGSTIWAWLAVPAGLPALGLASMWGVALAVSVVVVLPIVVQLTSKAAEIPEGDQIWINPLASAGMSTLSLGVAALVSWLLV